jgi:hypothetical protein
MLVKIDNFNNKDINPPINSYIIPDTYILQQPIKKENTEIVKIYNMNTEKNKKNEKHVKPCWCYNKESKDMRCCGLCYTFCYISNKDDQCYMCPETFREYYTSGYVITTDGYGHTGEECEDCLCTTLCLPFKLSLFWSCCFGSLFNNSINYCRNTNANYLF